MEEMQSFVRWPRMDGIAVTVQDSDSYSASLVAAITFPDYSGDVW